VLWIGGPPAAGKTTVARILARRHGLRLYSADTRTWTHRDRALAAGNPAARRWEALTPAERWERSTDAEMLTMSLHRERGAMVVEDLRALPSAPLVVAEGSPVPASAVTSGAALRSHAVWLLPSPGFQRARLAARGTPAGQTRLFVLLGEVVAREAREHDVPTLAVDTPVPVADTVRAVEQRFAGALAAGPRAGTVEERRVLLREVNEAVAAQVRGYHARPWAEGDPEAVVRAFVCECGDPACAAEIRLPVGDLTGGPVRAPGHGPAPPRP
jgi:hypothetical protein